VTACPSQPVSFKASKIAVIVPCISSGVTYSSLLRPAASQTKVARMLVPWAVR
jgi:hypothetical protein